VANRVKVTPDTNVYVSAFQFGGMRLLHMVVNRDIEVAVSQPILEEVIRVLRDKFEWDGYLEKLRDEFAKKVKRKASALQDIGKWWKTKSREC
jgi:predicted nucleic acid-binding protein